MPKSNPETIMTEKALSQNRTFTIHTSNRNHAISSLKFYHHEMSAFIPLRSRDLKTLRDALSEHIKANAL